MRGWKGGRECGPGSVEVSDDSGEVGVGLENEFELSVDVDVVFEVRDWMLPCRVKGAP